MSDDHPTSARLRWARLRFSIIGQLLAAPPEHGELRPHIEALAAKPYRHPTIGETCRFSVSTIERWFYAAKGAADPVAVLARKVPNLSGPGQQRPPYRGRDEAPENVHPHWLPSGP